MTDYAGNIFTMEAFSDTTDTGGDIVVSLQNTPVDSSSLIFSTVTPLMTVNFVGLTGSDATFKFRKLQYDRSDTDTSGSVTNLPSGVSADDTVGGPTFTSSGPSSTVESALNAVGNPASGSHSHTVQVNKISDHTHTFTLTDLPIAVTESVSLTVGYAF